MHIGTSIESSLSVSLCQCMDTDSFSNGSPFYHLVTALAMFVGMYNYRVD